MDRRHDDHDVRMPHTRVRRRLVMGAIVVLGLLIVATAGAALLLVYLALRAQP